ncbi:MAG: hypothetical protein JNK82_18855, partial [Myxococcaceae bacterium]|nr:hypothetical protein [Myxococcaceae bacterium]
KVRIDALAMRLGGANTPIAASQTKGPFRGVMTVVMRPGGQTIVVLALASQSAYSDAAARRLDDIAGGSALARAADQLAPSQCEVYTASKTAKADVLWVVDDSCSMFSSQTAVAAVGAQIVTRLTNALVDFRAAGVSTGYYAPDYAGSVRDWTDNITTMLSWFRGAMAWGTMGDPSENGFDGLTSFVNNQHPPNAVVMPGPPRADADLHIIFLSDAPEQSNLAPLQVLDLLNLRYPGRRVVLHAIVCPEGTMCGDGMEGSMGKYHDIVRRTGGVLGSILTFNAMTSTPALSEQQAETMKFVVQSVISGTGLQLAHRPVVASTRVATSRTQGSCDNTDVPRDDDHGWQLDSLTGRLSFAGNCAAPVGTTIAVSYQYWVH